jgi:predicted RNA-binding Zn ribbon-like protein
MVSVRFEAMPLSGLVDLVNGWGGTPRLEAGEQDWPYPPRKALASRLGLPAEAGPVTDVALTRVADRLHPVFAAEGLPERARIVDRLLEETAPRPSLVAGRDSARAMWLVDDRRSALLAAAALALRAHLLAHPGDRLGVCAGRRCADVYVDTSPGGRRRFCSVTCQNRARVAAFRRRRAGSAPSGA